MKVKISKFVVMDVYSDTHEVTVSSKGYKKVKYLCFKSAKKSAKTMGIPFFPQEVKEPICKIDESIEEDYCIIKAIKSL